MLVEDEADVAALEGHAIFLEEHSLFEPIIGLSVAGLDIHADLSVTVCALDSS